MKLTFKDNRIIRLKLLAFAVFLCSLTPHPGQCQDDRFIVHFDKGFYVCGEVIWYTVYVPANISQESKVLKCMIANAEGEILETHFLKTNRKPSVSGYYKIPFSLESGYYQLILKGVNIEENESIDLFRCKVPVYNDLKPLDANKLLHKNDFKEISDVSKRAGGLTIELELTGNTYEPQQTIEGMIKIRDTQGNLVDGVASISVLDAELAAVSEEPVLKFGDRLDPQITRLLGDVIYARGKVYAGGEQGVKANIMGAYSTRENKILFTQSDEDGDFILTIPDFKGQKEFQFLSYQREFEQIQTDLVEPDIGKIDEEVVYNDFLIRYLELSQLRKKIFQHYTSLESNLQIEETERDVFQLKPDHSYVVDEYESFEDMATFFKEILTPLRFGIENDKYKASVYNPSARLSSDRFFSGSPLFIIDGKITKDADYVAKMKMDMIERVDLFFNPQNLRRQFNVFGNSGVVRIVTNVASIDLPEPDMANVYDLPGLLPPVKPAADRDPSNKDSRKPDFKPQIYWNPELSVIKTGTRFTFDHTDDRGVFVIQIAALSEDGTFGFSHHIYRVLKQQQ